MAVQLPNPPILPLLIDTNSAKDSLPVGSELPNPPFAYQEDVIQIIARAKADFYPSVGMLPQGIVLALWSGVAGDACPCWISKDLPGPWPRWALLQRMARTAVVRFPSGMRRRKQASSGIECAGL